MHGHWSIHYLNSSFCSLKRRDQNIICQHVSITTGELCLTSVENTQFANRNFLLIEQSQRENVKYQAVSREKYT